MKVSQISGLSYLCLGISMKYAFKGPARERQRIGKDFCFRCRENLIFNKLSEPEHRLVVVAFKKMKGRMGSVVLHRPGHMARILKKCST